MAETREQQVLRIRTETIEYFHRLRRVEKLLPVPTDFNDIVVLQEFIHRLDTEREKEFAAESDSCPQPIGESANDDKWASF